MRVFPIAITRKERAFSLFEIAVAMSILTLISGAIFSILWQAGETASNVRELDKRDEEMARFIDLLRESIELLPPDGTISIHPAEETTSGFPELVIGNSSTAFIFGQKVGSVDETIISLRPTTRDGVEVTMEDGSPSYDLAMSRPDFEPNSEETGGMAFRVSADDFLPIDEEGRYWMPLLSGIKMAVWQYWDDQEQDWLDDRTDTSKMPPLLAFSISDEFHPVPMRVVFEIPEQVVNPPESESDTGAGASSGMNRNADADRTGNREGQAGDGQRGGRGDRGQRPGAGDRGGGGREGGGRGGPGGGRGGGGPGGPGGPGGVPGGQGGGGGPAGGGTGGAGGGASVGGGGGSGGGGARR